MANKKDQPQNDPGPNADEYGDAGGPIANIDPEEIVAHEESKVRAELEDWKSKYLHALADFQNFQRRSMENEREAKRQGVIGVVSHLMGVLDNFDLALKQDPGKATTAQIMQGVSMVQTQMLQALAALGVRAIEPKPGDAFDPHMHQAVAQVPSADIEPGRIAACFQVGYALGDRVLRPAKTSVAKAIGA